jgi:DNA-binding FadR family transcriptional regulator
MKAGRREPSRFLSSEAAFLREVSEIAGNAVLAGAVTTVRSMLKVWLTRLAYTTADIEASVTDYTAVADAIADGDARWLARPWGHGGPRHGRVRGLGNDDIA